MNESTTLGRPVGMLFALLKASLHEREVETSLFEGATDEEWRACYTLASSQGVMALAWDGVGTLPAALQPARPLKLTWASRVVMYEQLYERYCTTVDELSRLYAEQGIATMQLKGVGLSTLYPVPSHREGGDIDIYTYSMDTARMSHAEANRLADQLMTERGIEVDVEYYKHSNFYYKGIPIENHKSFLSIAEAPVFAHADQLLHKHMEPTLTTLAVGQVLTPSATFNSLFLALHAARHYGSGLALHHLCDWAVMLKHYGLLMPAEVTDKRFLRFVDAMTMLCSRYLGCTVEVEADEELAHKVLDEILHPRYTDEVKGKSRVGVFVYKLKRLFYNHRLANSIMRTSLARRLWSSVIFHVRRPETIFKW